MREYHVIKQIGEVLEKLTRCLKVNKFSFSEDRTFGNLLNTNEINRTSYLAEELPPERNATNVIKPEMPKLLYI